MLVQRLARVLALKAQRARCRGHAFRKAARATRAQGVEQGIRGESSRDVFGAHRRRPYRSCAARQTTTTPSDARNALLGWSATARHGDDRVSCFSGSLFGPSTKREPMPPASERRLPEPMIARTVLQPERTPRPTRAAEARPWKNIGKWRVFLATGAESRLALAHGPI